jgi:hypothetical protein
MPPAVAAAMLRWTTTLDRAFASLRIRRVRCLGSLLVKSTVRISRASLLRRREAVVVERTPSE